MSNSTPTKESVRSYFETDAAVHRWGSLYSNAKDFFSYAMVARRQTVVSVLRHLGPESGRIVADVGCGAGVVSQDLVELGYDVTGVDMSTEMLAKASRVPGLKTQQGDVEHLSFKSGSLDKLVCLGVITYLPDERRALSELRRVLRPGGTMVLAVRNRWEMGQRWDLLLAAKRGLRLLLGKRQSGPALPYFHRTFVPTELMQNVSAADFQITEILGRGFDVPTVLGRRWLPVAASGRFSRLMEKLAALRPLQFLNKHGLVLIIVAHAR